MDGRKTENGIEYNHRPSREEILASAGRTVPDVIAPGLTILFCGINPGLYSAAVRHHFARPGNRFWPVLHAAGYIPRLLSPYEEQELLKYGYGITNIVARASAAASELTRAELIEGGKMLEDKIHRYRPRCVAVLGVTAYRFAFNRPKAVIGPQLEALGGAPVWILPNPSGLNAHYQLNDLAALFRELREKIE